MTNNTNHQQLANQLAQAQVYGASLNQQLYQNNQNLWNSLASSIISPKPIKLNTKIRRMIFEELLDFNIIPTNQNIDKVAQTLKYSAKSVESAVIQLCIAEDLEENLELECWLIGNINKPYAEWSDEDHVLFKLRWL